MPADSGASPPDPRGAGVFAIALAPALLAHLVAFHGEALSAGAVFVASLALCATAAAVAVRIAGQPVRSVPQASAVVTGLLLPFCLPALPAYWLLALGAVLAIGLGRLAVPLQPLVATRTLLWFAFPHAMGVPPGIDAISGATPAGLRAMQEFLTSAGGTPSPELYLGIGSESLAGTMGLPLLVGGLYLVVRGAVGWRIPTVFLASVALLSIGAWNANGHRFLSPPYHLFRGDLMLGAFFLATDPRTSPRRPGAQIAFGIGCGAITALARMAGWFPESVPLAILAMNVCSPLLDRLPFRESAVAVQQRRRRPAVLTAALVLAVVGGVGIVVWPAIRRLESARDAAKTETFAAVLQTQPGGRQLDWVYSPAAGVSFTRSEITVAQFGACVQAGECERGWEVAAQQPNCNAGYPERGDHPMNCVTWKIAARYCAWAGGRLPTDAEWYAEASNAGARRYPWRNEALTCERAVWSDGALGDGCGTGHTWPVCSRPAGNSASGLCDLTGNVWEWTATEQRNEYFYIRGGGWNVARPENLESSARSYLNAYFRGFGSVGFRCVREAPRG